MKDAVVIAGGNRERGLILSDKLATEQYYAKFCQSFTDFCSTINQSKIAAILLLFPDEFGVINQLFEKNKIPDLVGREYQSYLFLRRQLKTTWRAHYTIRRMSFLSSLFQLMK